MIDIKRAKNGNASLACAVVEDMLQVIAKSGSLHIFRQPIWAQTKRSAAMTEFSDLFLELRTILDDPDSYYLQVSSQLDPNLVDELRGYAAARNVPLQEPVMQALQLFMLSSAEVAWRELSREAEAAGKPDMTPLNAILERFLTIALDPSRQKLIEGPEMPSLLNQFRRMPDE